tara:strand:- start:297 stop:779 length:483 start_codon:yes stop_codon:yes gene_type:complete
MNNTYNRLLDLVTEAGGVGSRESMKAQTSAGRASLMRHNADGVSKKDLDASWAKSSEGENREVYPGHKNPKQPLARKTRIPKGKFLNHKNTDLRKDEGKIGDLVQKVKDKVTGERARWNKAQGKAQDSVTGRGSFNKDPNAPFGRNNKGKPRKGVDNGRQ